MRTTRIHNYIHPGVCAKMRHEIDQAGGNEVFFIGRLDKESVVEEVTVVARGNNVSVPAVLAAVTSTRSVVIHNHPDERELEPSPNDIAISQLVSAEGAGSYIVDNELGSIYVIVEPNLSKRYDPLPSDEIAVFFSPESPALKHIRGFESRPQQKCMAEEVLETFNTQEILLVEAPTGTGKTYAYLIPSLLWCKKNKERLVVATHTINLQEQLLKKDLPAIAAVFKESGLELTYALAKGRGNYLCLRKLSLHEEEIDLFSDEEQRPEARAVAEWAKNTQDGSLSDLGFVPARNVWDSFSSDPESCQRGGCIFYQKCFYYKGRRAAAACDVIVANHHLLLADLEVKSLSAEGAVMPHFLFAVIDEAHNLEDAATSYAQTSVTRRAVQHAMGRLLTGKKKGLLVCLAKHTQDIETITGEAACGILNERLIPDLEALKKECRNLFDSIDREFEAAVRDNGSPESRTIQLTEEVISEHFALSYEAARSFSTRVQDFAAVFSKLSKGFQKKELPPTAAKLFPEVQAAVHRLLKTADAAASVFSSEAQGLITWIETENSGACSLKTAPLDVAEFLDSVLYSKLHTVIMTSGTLTVNGTFEFMTGHLGLQRRQDRLKTCKLAEIFDYKKQTLLCIPSDFDKVDAPAYPARLASSLVSMLSITRGRGLILFTSYKMMEQAHDLCRGPLKENGITALVQGTLPRPKLLQQYLAHPACALFATESFWEGIDIMGEKLVLLCITRLPFNVPTDPVARTRANSLLAHGKDPFKDYSIPLAVIKFRQGFGRLIRSKTDRGAVVIFDRRVTGSSYGRFFLNSIPDCACAIGTENNILIRLEEFFNTPSDAQGGRSGGKQTAAVH